VSLALRPLDLGADADAVVALFARYLNPLYDRARFDWVYRENPCGPPVAWVLVDSDGRLVGASGAFRRDVVLEGRERRVLLLGDLCIVDAHRALGPALRLQRACLNAVASEGAALCYDLPSQSMMAVYERLGVGRRADMVRFARPLRLDRHVRRFVRSAAVAHTLGAIGGTMIARRRSRTLGDERLVVAVHRGRCDQEFTGLVRTIGSAHGGCLSRSHEYLNWRYLDNPVERCEILTARRDGMLQGYLALGRGPAGTRILDIFADAPERTVPALLEAATARLRAEGAETASVPLLASPVWCDLLRRLGFHARERAPVMFHAVPPLPDSTQWFLTAADAE
jgi:hypothetical protein